MSDVLAIPLPRWEAGVVAVPAPGDGPGYWAGGPSAVLVDGVVYLAYRLRRPIGHGRGYANVVARSDDGVHFEPLVELHRDAFDAESLERPALVALPGGGFRVYVSCATPGSKHWRVDALDADKPGDLDPARRVTVLPGDDDWAVKDPVFAIRQDGWHMWATLHPLERADDADRMHTAYATSTDGLRWEWHETALAGRPGAWDSRGARVAAVIETADGFLAYYDGRATAEQNYEEQTGVAFGTTLSSFVARDAGPAASSPYGAGGLRYLTVLDLPDGSRRLYYEATRADGAHELRTELIPATS